MKVFEFIQSEKHDARRNALRSLVNDVVLLDSDELSIDDDGQLRVVILHSITCNDFPIIQETLMHYYWAIGCPLRETFGFELRISKEREDV